VSLHSKMTSAKLFSEIKIRDVTLPNRIVVAPMCTYGAGADGVPTASHMVQYGHFAMSRPGLIFVEATGIVPEGRITPACTGFWNDDQVAEFKKIVDVVHQNGSKIGLQLAHAGRKSSTGFSSKSAKPRKTADHLFWLEEEDGGWDIVGPSPLEFSENGKVPKELSREQILELVQRWADAAKKAVSIGFDVVEIHGAHGYLLHSFMSPISNKRTDEYGGSLENRIRFPIEVATAVRKAIPESTPVFFRISSTDWVEDEPSWDIQQSVELAKRLKEVGVDVVDCSSAGLTPKQRISVFDAYQVPFAQQIRKEADILTMAVGKITEAGQAEQILDEGKADFIGIGRAMSRNPRWPIDAALKLGMQPSLGPHLATCYRGYQRSA